jgi:hypothetical protein
MAATKETYTPDSLIAGTYPIVTGKVTVFKSVKLARGSVLGEITATGKYLLTDKASVDGSEVASVILAADVDATAADVVGAPVYLSGQFDTDSVVFGGASVSADHIKELRDVNIYLTGIL